MNGNSDAVDDVLAAFSDHLERGAPRPTLEHLDLRDRQEAEDLMLLMETGRAIDPATSAPSLEALLADTEFADAVSAVQPSEVPVLDRLLGVLAEVDSRAEVAVEGDFVSFSYLDLLAQFHPLESDGDPSLPDSSLRALFDADAYVDLVVLVATRTDELLSRVVSRYDVDPTVSTGGGRTGPVAPPVLPLALAARAILERSVPEWGQFGFEPMASDFVDVADLQMEITTRLVAAEAKRRYQGDKAAAYRGMVGQEHRVVELITIASRGVRPADSAAEVDLFIRQVS